MKYFLLTTLCSLIFSFSFSQDRRVTESQSMKVQAESAKLDKAMKKNSEIAINYLTKKLRLNEKQKKVIEKSFYNYGRNISRARTKVNMLQESQVAEGKEGSEFEKKKYINNHMMRFVELRDNEIRQCLDKKQSSLYQEVAKNIDPLTLQIKDKERKKK